MRKPEQVSPLPNLACPVCGESNQCGPAASGSFESACWCAGVTIAPEALGRIPAAQRGKACLCPRCAGVPDPALPGDSREVRR